MHDALDESIHRRLAAELFNQTWELLDVLQRTPDQDEEMIRRAYASRYHWGVVGTTCNHARGEWLLARVHETLDRTDTALRHARACLATTLDEDLGAFDLAFAHEGMARALATDDPEAAPHHRSEARRIGEAIEDTSERKWLNENLEMLERE